MGNPSGYAEVPEMGANQKLISKNIVNLRIRTSKKKPPIYAKPQSGNQNTGSPHRDPLEQLRPILHYGV